MNFLTSVMWRKSSLQSGGTRRVLLPLAAACLLGLLAGCGSSSKSASSSTPATSSPAQSSQTSGASSSATAGPGNRVNVSETEFRLTPSAVKVAGGKLTVTVNNVGGTNHALEIENGGPGGKDLRSAPIRPGGTATLVATLKAGKSYVWYCPIANHRAMGMHGTITVSAAGAVSKSSRATSTSSSGSAPSSSAPASPPSSGY